MQKVKLLFLSGFVLIFCAHKPANNSAQIKWMDFSEVEKNQTKEKRPVLIDVYTSWCGWCKVMESKTYANRKVAEYVQGKFYPVKFNAETKDQINWEGKIYNYNSNYRCNEFALYILQGRLEFPTTVIIPMDGSQPQAIPGYLPTKDFELIAKYFGEGEFGKTPFEEYQKKFKSSW